MPRDRERIFFGSLIVGLVMTVGFFALPRLSWAPPLIKMGVVNWEQVVMEYEAYQTELQDLQKRRKRVLQFLNREYESLGGGGSGKNQELKSMYQDTLKQIKKRRERIIETYHQKINEAIEQEAVEQGFSLILSENEVLYASEEYTDLTHNVIERLNAQSNPDQP